MSDLVKRALQILGTAVVDTGKEYTSNASSFINDAKDVHSMITKQSTDIADTYTRLKNTNFTKKISDWFYQKEAEADLDAADEFDAGIKVDSDSSDSSRDGETASHPLSTESMTDIFEKSTAAAYKIGRKQTEQSVINTSEIVSTFNSRSSEIITSINNLNKTLIDIRTTLNNFAKAYGSVQLDATEKSNIEDKSSLYSGGQLSLGRIFEASKKSLLEENTVITTGRELVSALLQGGPEQLATQGLQALLGKINMPGTDKSIDRFAKDLNETIGEAIQTGLSEAIGSKWFKAVFGDIAKIDQNFNYHNLTANNYTTKRATFDGMTRMSIVTLIPEMLAKINEAVSGKSYHIDNSGHWAEGPMKDKFIEVTNNAFASSGIGYKGRTNISNAGMRTVGKQIPDDDIELAGEAMTGMFVNYILNDVGTTNFTINDLKTMDTSDIIADATMMCYNAATHGDERYWAKVCQTIILTLSSDMSQAHKFVTNINTSARSMMDSAKEFAQSGAPNAHQARVISKSMMQQQFLATKHSTGSIYDNAEKGITSIPKKSEVDGRVDGTLAKKTRHGINEYVEGIYEILNRGVNVKVLKKKGKFEDHVLGQRGISENDDDTFAKMFLEGATSKNDEKNLKNIIKMSMEETTNSLLGIENANKVREGGIAALLSGNGFLGSAVGAFGAQALKSAANGTLGQDFAARKDNVINTAKGGVDKITAAVSNLLDAVSPGILRNNRKLMGLKAATFGEGGFIDEATGKVVDTAKSLPDSIGGFVDERISSFMSKTIDKNGKFGKFANKAMYNLDTKALSGANKLLDDYIPENEWDQFYLSTCRKLIDEGKYDQATTMAENIKSSSVKAVVNKAISICQKRLEGEYAIAAGETPSIGAVSDSQLQTMIDTKSAGKTPSLGKVILTKIGNGIKNIGSIVGKIYSFLWKTFKSGIQDIFYGGRTWIRGWVAIVNNSIGIPIRFGISQIKSFIDNGRKFVKETAWPWIYKSIHDIRTKINGWFSKLAKSARNALGSVSERMGNWLDQKFSGGKGKKSSGLWGAFKEGFYEPWNDKKKSLAQDEAENPLMAKIREAVDKIKDRIPELPEDKLKKSDGEKSKVNPVDTIAETLAKDKEKNPLLNQIFDLLTDWKKDYNDDNQKIDSDDYAAHGAKDGHSGVMDDLEGATPSSDLGKAKSDTKSKTMRSISTVSESTSGESAGDAAGEAAGAAGGSMVKGMLKGILKGLVKGIGQALGGPIKLIIGLLKSTLTVVTGFTIVKETMKDFKEIFETSVKQLKPVVTEVMKVFKNMMPAFKTIMDTIMESIKMIVEPVVKTIEPLMKTLVPLIVKGVQFISKVIVPRVVWLLEKLMPKIAKLVAGLARGVEIISGFVQATAGGIMWLTGTVSDILAKIVGNVAKTAAAVSTGFSISKILTKYAFTGKVDAKDVTDLAASQSTATAEAETEQAEVASKVETSMSRADMGKQWVIEGIMKILGLTDNSDMFASEPKDYSGTVDTSNVNLTSDFGSGDPGSTYNVTNNYSYTYGSGNVTNNQHSYGNYMNMSERGCGPVALADAYARRTGASINPRTLAEGMVSTGAYVPTKGTSIASMIVTGNALGMGLHTGGVTANSLKRATPTNPITVYGSGVGFGTRNGNGHYVNVVGNDGNGNVYVSNPLTGRIGKQNVSAIVANSKLGLYGSGDADDYGFDEGTNEAMANLKALTDRLTGMFSLSGDPVADAETESQANQIKTALSTEEIEQIENNEEYQAAFEKYKSWQKQGTNEDDASFIARIKQKFAKTGTALKLIVKLGTSMYQTKLASFMASVENAAAYDNSLSEAVQSGISENGDGSMVSTIGAEMAPYSPIKYTETNIAGTSSGASPVHDFFSATNGRGYNAYTANGGWYGKVNDPDKTGQGKSGSASDGILITMPLSDGKTALIKAITGGTVTYVGKGGKSGPNSNGGLGNHVKWRDSAGMYHWYYHLGSIDSKISEGSTIEPGQLIGVIGKDSDRPTGLIDENKDAFGYTLSKIGPYGSTGDGTENPLAYWKFERQEALSGDSEKDKIFNYLVNTLGLSAKGAAGVMGVFESESGNIAARLEGDYAFPNAFGTATKSNAALNSYTTDQLFPYYAKQGISIDKGAYRAEDGNYYPGFGLAQWTGPRGKQIGDYGKSKSSNWEDLAVQLAFIREELTSSRFSGLMGAIKNPASPQNAADAWMTQYEAGGSGTNPYNTWLYDKRNNSDKQITERRKNADSIYDAYKNKKPISSASTTSDSEADIIGRFISTMSNVSTNSYFSSSGGAPLFTGQYTPTVTSLNITGAAKSESPLHEFFSMMTGRRKDSANSQNSSWYGQYNNPDSSGVGHSGDPHGGIDINTDYKTGDDEGSPLYATTGGTVVQAGWSDSAGNNILWQDSAGFYHWYMHLRDAPLKNGKDKIDGGTLLGYMGNTGDSRGAHLHYSIHSQQPAWSSDYTINPLKYFSNYNASAGDSTNSSGGNKGGLTHNISSITPSESSTVYSGDGPFLPKESASSVVTVERGPSSMWDISTWSNMTDKKRSDTYTELAKLHAQACNKSPSYATTYQQGLKSDWKSMYEAYATGKNADYWDTASTEAQLAELRSIIGAGDVSSISSTNIPPVDFSKLSDQMNDTVTPYVNMFNIKPDSSSKDDMLKKMSQMTFNVRAQRVEELLENLISIVSEGKNKVPSTAGTSSNHQADPFLFNNEIPPQVTRLARG